MTGIESTIIEEMIPINRILPYYKIALKVAQDSPCIRRKFGSVIIDSTTGYFVSACNARVSDSCDRACIRDRYGAVNGASTELGAEVHSEQAALIDAQFKGDVFVLAGWQSPSHTRGFIELRGTGAFPCLPCARMIKYAGFKYVHMMREDGILTPYGIIDIMQYREASLGPHYE